jgi:hypothetical protein
LTLPSTISADGSNEVLAGAYWKNGSTTLMLLGGSFTSSNGVRDIGLYNQNSQALMPLNGETITGVVRALAVVNDVAWIGGDFTTGAGRQGLSTYGLKNSTLLDSVPALTGSCPSDSGRTLHTYHI